MELAIQATVNLLAVFIGALSAFWLENFRRSRETKKSQVAAGNRAIFVLARIWNELMVVRNQLIEPVRSNPARMVAMQAMIEKPQEKVSIEATELSYLLDKKQGTLLMKLLIDVQFFLNETKSKNLVSHFFPG